MSALTLPRRGTIAGLRRLFDDPDTAVQVLSYDEGMHTSGEFGTLRSGTVYWPSRGDRKTHIRFVNSVTPIAFLFGTMWTYKWENTDHEAIIATRRTNRATLRIRIYQPEVLAAAWSGSLIPDRIEND